MSDASALAGVRVAEVGSSKALAYAGKLLRDLGAEVVKVEPPEGDPLRAYGPFPADRPHPEQSGLFIYLHGGKRGARLELSREPDRGALLELLSEADMLLHDLRPSQARALGLDHAGLASRNEGLIVVAVTTFGSTGPYAEWRGYALQAAAGSGLAIRVGDPEREPLTAPLDGAELHHAAVHAAAAALLALVHRRRSGRGQFVDVSALDAAAGVSGWTFLGPLYDGEPEEPRSGRGAAIDVPGSGLVESADGDFALNYGMDREWRQVLEAMGSPEWGDDPRFATVEALRALPPKEQAWVRRKVRAWVRSLPSARLWERTRAVHNPSQPVHTIPQVWQSDQLRERGFAVEAPGPHPSLRVPGAPYRLSATPLLPPGAPPVLAEAMDAASLRWSTRHEASPGAAGRPPPAPLEGVRVLDLGQVWAGPVLGRYLADYGAEVICVETAARPRRMPGATAPEGARAWESMYRNRRSISLDLRRPEAIDLFKRLVAVSDVVLDNFAPSVMPKLGLDHETLAELNQRIISAALSTSGRGGPWSDLVTYGTTLSALYGIKSLNGYPEDRRVVQDTAELDPIAATYGAVAILAALLQRERSDRGQFIDLAQGEAGLAGVAEAIIEHEWNGRDLGPVGNSHRALAPHGVYPCARGRPLDRDRLRPRRRVGRPRLGRCQARLARPRRVRDASGAPRGEGCARRRDRGLDQGPRAPRSRAPPSGEGCRRLPRLRRTRRQGRPAPAPPPQSLRAARGLPDRRPDRRQSVAPVRRRAPRLSGRAAARRRYRSGPP